MQMMPGSERGGKKKEKDEEREERRKRKKEKLKEGEGGMVWMKGESERGRKIGRVEEDGREGQRNGWKEGRK